MRTIVQLSDLHFGRDDRTIAAALQGAVLALSPDVIAISGDFTQRARRAQFRAARAFVATLPHPLVVVPGNHDVPLYNVAARFLWPLAGYKRHITSDLTPQFADDEVLVLGTNTTKSLTIKGGGIRETEVERLSRIIHTSGRDEQVVIVVAHHPLDDPIKVQALIDAGVDVFLTGHLHVSAMGHTAERYQSHGRSAIVVEAGTATSTRVRGAESNAFNMLRVTRDQIVVEHRSWQAGEFVITEAQTFRHTKEGWQPARGV